MKRLIGVLIFLLGGISECRAQTSYLCPKRFVTIGRKCYFFSRDEALWHDAYFRCRNFNSSLAIINKPHQESVLRKYLNGSPDGKFERWLGGRYNERKSRWVWGENGKPLEFHGFSRMNLNSDQWSWHCTITDPERQNKWSARSCIDKKRYICQRKILGKRKSNRSKCSTGSGTSELCNVGSSAPGYLVQPIKPYDIATFICPSNMILVGRKCYFFSKDKVTWGSAYWSCRDNGTKLAVLSTRMQDNILRGFLNAQFTAENHERWIGGIFDWKQNKWKWAMSGKVVKYKNFAKEAFVVQKNNTHHCITLDPLYENKWNSKDRFQENYYICQAKSQSVVKYRKLAKIKSTASSFTRESLEETAHTYNAKY